jgi:predicted O-methyltransferase YrrM
VARRAKPRVIVQSGVFAGYSACLLAEACRQNGEGIVHCIDPNVPHRQVSDPMASARELVEDLGLSAYVRFHKGTFATPLWAREERTPGAELAPVVGPQVFAEAGRADLVFVDGDHTVPAVLADITLAVCHLADKGTVLVHDTMSWPQVRLAISAMLSENRVGVRSTDDYAFLRPYGRRALHFFELCPGGIDGLGLLTLSPLPSASAAQD